MISAARLAAKNPQTALLNKSGLLRQDLARAGQDLQRQAFLTCNIRTSQGIFLATGAANEQLT
jgi:hypothetical protein